MFPGIWKGRSKDTLNAFRREWSLASSLSVSRDLLIISRIGVWPNHGINIPPNAKSDSFDLDFFASKPNETDTI